jgi:hypothetical protein
MSRSVSPIGSAVSKPPTTPGDAIEVDDEDDEVRVVDVNPGDGGGGKRKAAGSGKAARRKKSKNEKEPEEAKEVKEAPKTLLIPHDAVYHEDKVRNFVVFTAACFDKLV